MSDLIEWLKLGIDGGHITSGDAFAWLARKSSAPTVAPASAEAPAARLHPVAKAPPEPAKSARLKKDGSPWGRTGRKPRQSELPHVNGSGQQ
jgi:hypothetical protein